MTKKIRQEFADTLLEVGQHDPNLIVLIGDISHFLLQPFAEACPGRFYNIGICEQTMVSMAAGLAKVGMHPVLHTITPFLIERPFEQLKVDFGYQKLGANIISVGGAFDYGALGCTHHCYDDFSLIKGIPGSQIIYPSSCKEFNMLFKQTYNNGKLTYCRIPNEAHDVEFKDEQIIFGKGIKVMEGMDLTIIAVGPQLKNAVEAANLLKNEGVSADVIYLHTLKPFDKEIVRKSLEKTKKCLVIEEHSMYGGVFDDVLRFSKDIMGVTYSSINIGNEFIHEYGTYQQHCKRLGFSVDGIIEKVKKELL